MKGRRQKKQKIVWHMILPDQHGKLKMFLACIQQVAIYKNIQIQMMDRNFSVRLKIQQHSRTKILAAPPSRAVISWKVWGSISLSRNCTYYCMCAVCMWVGMPWYICGSQKTTLWSWYSLFNFIWTPGLKLRSLQVLHLVSHLPGLRISF